MQDIRIYVCCHKDYEDVGIDNPCYKLISDKDIKNDSKLELIKSDGYLDNRLWSELTQIYYIFTHPELQGDWIGLCHYRRYFDFMNDIPELTKPIVPKNIFQSFNNYINYDICHYGRDLLTVSQMIQDIDESYMPYILNMLDSHHYLPYNMFILPKDVFNDLWSFIFKVLFEFDKKIDVNNSYEKMLMHIGDYREGYLEKNMEPNNTYQYQARLYGFLSERLLTAFFVKRINEVGKDSFIQQDVVTTEKTYNQINENYLETKKEKDQ